MTQNQGADTVGFGYTYTKTASQNLDSATLSTFARYTLREVYEFLLNERSGEEAPEEAPPRINPPREALFLYLESFLPSFHYWYTCGDRVPEDPIHLHWNSLSLGYREQFDRVFPRPLQIRLMEAAFRTIVSEESEAAVITAVRTSHRKHLPSFLLTEMIFTLIQIAAEDHLSASVRYEALLNTLRQESTTNASERQSAEEKLAAQVLQKARDLLTQAGWTVYPPAKP